MSRAILLSGGGPVGIAWRTGVADGRAERARIASASSGADDPGVVSASTRGHASCISIMV